MIGHRSSAMEQLLQKMAPQLQAVARTSGTVLISTTSATGFMEMAVRSGVRQRACRS
jgi:aspartate aminotransferase-like enzyme